MVTIYDYYTANEMGQLTREQFEGMLPTAQDTLTMVAIKYAPFWKVSSIDWTQESLYKSLCLQVEFINSLGGTDVLIQGRTDLDITEVDTPGFKYKYDSKASKTEEGVPVHPLARIFLIQALRSTGILYRGI